MFIFFLTVLLHKIREMKLLNYQEIHWDYSVFGRFKTIFLPSFRDFSQVNVNVVICIIFHPSIGAIEIFSRNVLNFCWSIQCILIFFDQFNAIEMLQIVVFSKTIFVEWKISCICFSSDGGLLSWRRFGIADKCAGLIIDTSTDFSIIYSFILWKW